jgi:D-glycerate 3-kinase
MAQQKNQDLVLSHLLTRWVDGAIEQSESTPILMLSGAQGIGKSFAFNQLLRSNSRNIAVIGLDDVYHIRGTRQSLARTIHPLCETRGPPGTHDLDLLHRTIEALLAASAGDKTPLPRFDKPSDDRSPSAHWPIFTGRPDAIVIEGWMMGALYDGNAPKAAPMNAVEIYDDQGVWRGWQETALKTQYAPLWSLADAFLHLCAPDFSAVLAWRLQQEESNLGLKPGSLPEARRAWVSTFIQHFERITRRMLCGQRTPGHAIDVDASRKILRAPETLR